MTVTLDPGTYFIIVDGFSNVNAGAFTLNVNVTPANDTCANAVDISAGGTFQGTTFCAGNDGAGGTVACTSGGEHDVWYQFTLARREAVYLRAQNAGYDGTLSIRTSCGSGPRVCNDDSCGSLQHSHLTDVLNAGTYYVLVDGFAGGQGDFTLTYQHTPACAAANESMAIQAPGTYMGSTIGLVNDVTPGCPLSTNAPDFVYYFPGCMGNGFSANNCGNGTWDSVLQLRSDACNGPQVGALCNDDDCNNAVPIFRSSRIPTGGGTTPLPATGMYALVVDGYSTSSGVFSVNTAF